MPITPTEFLALMLACTVAARLIYITVRRRHRNALQELAREWRMHYSPRDRFDLAGRVAERFPLPGAAEMRVADLIYGTERGGIASEAGGPGGPGGGGEFYRFIFSAEYTSGVTRAKHRHRRVVTFREPKARTTSADWSPLMLAPEELPTIEQYRALREQIDIKQSDADRNNI